MKSTGTAENRLWDKRSLHTRLYITIGCLLDCLYMNGILPSDSSSQIREWPALHDKKQCSEHHTLFPHTCGRVWTWDYFHIAPFKVHTVMKDVSLRPFCKLLQQLPVSGSYIEVCAKQPSCLGSAKSLFHFWSVCPVRSGPVWSGPGFHHDLDILVAMGS